MSRVRNSGRRPGPEVPKVAGIRGVEGSKPGQRELGNWGLNTVNRACTVWLRKRGLAHDFNFNHFKF